MKNGVRKGRKGRERGEKWKWRGTERERGETRHLTEEEDGSWVGREGGREGGKRKKTRKK